MVGGVSGYVELQVLEVSRDVVEVLRTNSQKVFLPLLPPSLPPLSVYFFKLILKFNYRKQCNRLKKSTVQFWSTCEISLVVTGNYCVYGHNIQYDESDQHSSICLAHPSRCYSIRKGIGDSSHIYLSSTVF